MIKSSIWGIDVVNVQELLPLVFMASNKENEVSLEVGPLACKIRQFHR